MDLGQVAQILTPIAGVIVAAGGLLGVSATRAKARRDETRADAEERRRQAAERRALQRQIDEGQARLDKAEEYIYALRREFRLHGFDPPPWEDKPLPPWLDKGGTG